GRRGGVVACSGHCPVAKCPPAQTGRGVRRRRHHLCRRRRCWPGRELTCGEGADVVVDVTAETMAPIAHAVEMARPGGTIILAGVKGAAAAIPDLKNDRIFSKELTIRGVKNADFD